MSKYTVYIETESSLETVENAIKDLFSKVTVHQIKEPNWCYCKNENFIDWDAFGGGKCRICGGDTF